MDSILEKLHRRGLPVTLASLEENLNDVAGVRVICSFVDDIYMLADCLLQQDDITLIERKDYIKNPKESGYRSLHRSSRCRSSYPTRSGICAWRCSFGRLRWISGRAGAQAAL